jgi:DNA-binding transcriptional LysR family regulator
VIGFAVPHALAFIFFPDWVGSLQQKFGPIKSRSYALNVKQSGTAIHLDRVYETDMAEGLKAMALEGHGIAFLPRPAAECGQERVVRKKLVGAGEKFEMTMDIRIYRERPASSGSARTLRRRSGLICRLRIRPARRRSDPYRVMVKSLLQFTLA